MNNKEAFEKWFLDNSTEKSNAGSSYITSLEWLSDRFYQNNKIKTKSIFEIEDMDVIDELYSEVKEMQAVSTSYIYNKDAPSYGKKHFYSASLGKYKQFLLTKNSVRSNLPQDVDIDNENFDIRSFRENVYKSGLVFSELLITRFVSSLLSKPFVLLTGLSGSGKTKIALSFVKWICKDEDQYKIIPVGADWTNREPLLGYPNGLDVSEYISPDSGVLRLILDAVKEENQDKPYFLILDEMNLSHVERYFADFLSVMESGDKIMLHGGSRRTTSTGDEIPTYIYWPTNLFVIGTVNIDETTYMFSPKVLDRANTIEFRIDERDIKSFFDLPSKVDLCTLEGKGAAMAEDFLQIAADKHIEPNEYIAKTFTQFFKELRKIGAEFGYRTAIEMLLLVKNLDIVGNVSQDEKIDIAVMQKLLPKLHGSRGKIAKVLDALILLCLKDGQLFSINKSEEVLAKDIIYPITFEKLVRMYKNALDNGFTSYAEA